MRGNSRRRIYKRRNGSCPNTTSNCSTVSDRACYVNVPTHLDALLHKVTLCPRPIFERSAALTNLTSSITQDDLLVSILQRRSLGPNGPEDTENSPWEEHRDLVGRWNYSWPAARTILNIAENHRHAESSNTVRMR
jgi:hypothetical protein